MKSLHLTSKYKVLFEQCIQKKMENWEKMVPIIRSNFFSCLSFRIGVPILKLQDQNHLGLNKQFSSEFLLTYFTCIISFSVNIKLYLVHTTFWQWIMVRNSYVNLRCRKNYIFSIWGSDTLKLAHRNFMYLCTFEAKKYTPN